MLEKIYIKTAEGIEDAAIISQLAEKIWSEHYTSIIGHEQVEYMLMKFQSPNVIYNDIKSGRYSYYLAYDKAMPAGYLAVSFDKFKREIFLSKIYVDKSSRGKGIARKFIEMLKGASEGEYSTIRLTVNKKNIDSINIYKKLGFEICDKAVTDIGNGFVMDDYIMRLILAEE